jgi:hypothetical protein
MSEHLVNQIMQDLQAHLQTAQVVRTTFGEFRLPVGAITCGDGTQFSVQASRHTYCAPRDDHGPWSKVEVMTLTEGATPAHWEHSAGDNLAGYVPLKAVAQEILMRGGAQHYQIESNLGEI